MKLTIRHLLTLPLGAPSRSVAHLLLTPSVTAQQKVEQWSISMPGMEGASTFRDGFGNRAHLVTQVRPDSEITIAVTGRIEMIDKAGILGRLDHDPMPAVFRRATAATAVDPALLADLARDAGRIGILHELMSRTHEMATRELEPSGRQSQSQGEAGTEAGQLQSQEERGAVDSATDAAQAFVGAVRALGIPARFVRGYLFEDGNAEVHCWAEAWDDGLGWIGFDPRLNLCPTTGHIRIACGLDAGGTPAVRMIPAPTGAVSETVEIEDQTPST